MEMIVWNSQGGKWDTLYETGLKGPIGNFENVFGLVVESGWAPWVLPGGIQLEDTYYLDSTLTYYDEASAKKSALAKAFLDFSEQRIRGQRAFWVPWMKTKDPISVNTRCSIGGAYFPQKGSGYTLEVQVRMIKQLIRPSVQLTISREKVTLMTVYLVHFVASKKAASELKYLTEIIGSIVAEGTPALVLGDINVNILNTPTANVPLKDYWYLLRTNKPTHIGKKGKLSELDYGLLYDPNYNNQDITVKQVAQFKSPTNPSDHSMLRYSFTGNQW